MRRLVRTGCVVLISLMGVACSGGESDHVFNGGGEAAKTAAQPSKPDHVWKGDAQALEKAKGVESTIMDAARQHDREMEKQGE